MTDPQLPPRAVRATIWAVLLLCACGILAFWWDKGRPVNLPDAVSPRIACVSYAPFRLQGESPTKPGAMVTPERIDADLKALSTRFDCVRTYAMAQGLSAVPEIAARYGMKVIMGVWIGRDVVSNESEIKLAIEASKKYQATLRGIVVGNEVLLRGEQSEKALAAYIERVRNATTVPVTYADVWEFWLAHPALASSVSYITVHILPYWEDDPVPPEQAIEHVGQVYQRVKNTFPGKEVMIGETGWPSAGFPRRKASASLVNEARYIREFLNYAATVDMPYNLIETFDQPWKRAQEGTPGGYWGIFTVDDKPKFPMLGPVVEVEHWWGGWLSAGAGALLMVTTAGWWQVRRRAAALGVSALAGIATGGALAAHARLLWVACQNEWEWAAGVLFAAFGLFTAVCITRAIAQRIGGASDVIAPFHRQRLAWMFMLSLYGLLLVFDGRYRDFPVALFILPAVGFTLGALLRATTTMPMLEERLMAAWLPVLGLAVVFQQGGLNATAWLWGGVNLLLAAATFIQWRAACTDARLAQHTYQQGERA
jgi:exo-beta-1,3-glucanase (GH17 family)